MPLSKAIQKISKARYELAESNRQQRADLEVAMIIFIGTADAQECLLAINVLIARVSSITGEAGDLENAACVLIRHIDNEG